MARAIAIVVLLMCCAASARARVVANGVKKRAATIRELESQNLYNRVPNIELRLVDGRRARLVELSREKPYLVTLFYKRCPGACSPFLRSLKKAVAAVGGLGEDFRIVSLSFDARDTLADTAKMASELDIPQNGDWSFGIAGPEELHVLAEAIGFWYKKDLTSGQFDHPTLIAAVDGGRLVRVLIGATVNGSRLREVVYDLKGVFVPTYSTPDENILFRCLAWNAAKHEMEFSGFMLLLFVPAILALVVVGVVFLKRER